MKAKHVGVFTASLLCVFECLSFEFLHFCFSHVFPAAKLPVLPVVLLIDLHLKLILLLQYYNKKHFFISCANLFIAVHIHLHYAVYFQYDYMEKGGFLHRRLYRLNLVTLGLHCPVSWIFVIWSCVSAPSNSENIKTGKFVRIYMKSDTFFKQVNNVHFMKNSRELPGQTLEPEFYNKEKTFAFCRNEITIILKLTLSVYLYPHYLTDL